MAKPFTLMTGPLIVISSVYERNFVLLILTLQRLKPYMELGTVLEQTSDPKTTLGVST